MKGNLEISNRAFWDTDFSKLDTSHHKDFIISRVFNYGKWEDILSINSFYGQDVVVELLINSENLTENGLQIASSFFKINKERFKCYTRKQYHPSSVKH